MVVTYILQVLWLLSVVMLNKMVFHKNSEENDTLHKNFRSTIFIIIIIVSSSSSWMRRHNYTLYNKHWNNEKSLILLECKIKQFAEHRIMKKVLKILGIKHIRKKKYANVFCWTLNLLDGMNFLPRLSNFKLG